MMEEDNVIWTTTTMADSQMEARITLTENELTIDIPEESREKIDEKGRKLAEKVMNVFLPYKVEIKNIRKVKRGPKKIVIVSKGLLKQCTIGLPEPELDQLEAELKRLIN